MYCLRCQDQTTLAALFGILFVLIFFLALTGKESGTVKHFRFQIDLNTAESAELQTLPGIGEKLAQGIIDYRKNNGTFRRAEELDNVRGIGVKKLAAAEPFILPLPADKN